MITRKVTPDIRAMNAALKSYRDSIGKTTQRFHFVNEARLVHFALTGRNQAISDIKSATRLKRKQYTLVLCLNSQLISHGVDYKLRKQVCRQVFEKQKGKSST